MNILRRLPLSRLLLVCAVMVAVGVSATALAFGLDSGPTPPSKPLAEAVHEALAAPPVEGVSASVHLTNHLLEGAGLASAGGQAGQLASSPLFSGASGRLWIAKDGRVRLELQSEKGDTQILYDGHTVSLYDASSNTLYRYAIPAKESGSTDPSTTDQSGSGTAAEHREVPTIAKIEEAISHLKPHATLSDPTPTNIAGQPAYTTRISPSEGGSLIGGAEVSWDAVHGVPLRAAVYSSSSSSPVIELTTTEVSYGPVDGSVFSFTPPSGTKINEVSSPTKDTATHTGASPSDASAPKGSSPNVTTRDHGIAQIAVLESKAAQGSSKPSANLPEGLPKVKVNGASASELPTALGTLLSFERSGVRYLLLGAVTPATIEAVAKGL
jgi:outer membrane lipoprotein-sorting protein